MNMEDQSCKTSRWRVLKSKLNNLSAEAFKKRISEDEKAVIIDVRTAQEFAECFIPEAINLDYLAEDFWDRIETLPKDRNYYVYCRSGRRSIRVCTLMRNGGFDNTRIFNLSAGYANWKEAFPDVLVQ